MDFKGLGETGKCLGVGNGNGGCLGFPLKCLISIFLILYIISPIDLIPVVPFGPIGLIDDAIAFLILMGMNGTDIFGKLKGLAR